MDLHWPLTLTTIKFKCRNGVVPTLRQHCQEVPERAFRLKNKCRSGVPDRSGPTTPLLSRELLSGLIQSACQPHHGENREFDIIKKTRHVTWYSRWNHDGTIDRVGDVIFAARYRGCKRQLRLIIIIMIIILGSLLSWYSLSSFRSVKLLFPWQQHVALVQSIINNIKFM